jgi:N-acetyl-gamma-glutamylphosphate reductase
VNKKMARAYTEEYEGEPFVRVADIEDYDVSTVYYYIDVNVYVVLFRI